MLEEDKARECGGYIYNKKSNFFKNIWRLSRGSPKKHEYDTRDGSNSWLTHMQMFRRLSALHHSVDFRSTALENRLEYLTVLVIVFVVDFIIYRATRQSKPSNYARD